jgi:hypothetical protein
MEETGFGIVNSSTSYLPGPDGLKPPTVQHGVENDQDEANIVMKEYKLLLLTVLKDALHYSTLINSKLKLPSA